MKAANSSATNPAQPQAAIAGTPWTCNMADA